MKTDKKNAEIFYIFLVSNPILTLTKEAEDENWQKKLRITGHF